MTVRIPSITSLVLTGFLILCSLLLNGCQQEGEIEKTEIGFNPQQDNTHNQFATTEAQLSVSVPPPTVRFEHLSVEDGLAHSAVNAITQDELGFMWFGTQNGLNMYDGHQFLRYRHDPDDDHSLRDNFIESLYGDSEGTLWVGTQEGWLERFNRSDGSFTHYDLSAHVYAIVEDSEGSLWLGSKIPGLLRFNPDTGMSQTIWPALDVMAVIVDNEGQIWAASPEEGLARYDPTSDQLTVFPLDHPAHDLAIDSEGFLWLATWGGGVGKWDEARARLQFNPVISVDQGSSVNNYISAIYSGDNGKLWFGNYEGVLSLFDPQIDTLTHYEPDPTDPFSLSLHGVLSIYEDRMGVLWVGGATGGGIHQLTVGADRFGHYRPIADDPNSLSSALVTSISSDDQGVVWLGTFTGLDRWDQTTGLWRNYKHSPDDPTSLAHDTVRSVFVDSNDTLWIGTEGGLDRFDPKVDGFDHIYGPVVMWINESTSGNLWMATKDGFFEFDSTQEEFYLIEEGFAWKIMVLEDDQGRVWVGSSGDGLGLFDPASGSWTEYTPDPADSSSISDNFVETIHQDQAGRLWFGTANGLSRFDDESGTFINFQVNDGLPDDRIAGILEDGEGKLWLSTNGGLSRFDPEVEIFENFTVRDGLQSNIFWRNAYHKSPDGKLFFGGDNGINAFYSEGIVTNRQVPPVVITGLSLFNQPLRSVLSENDQLTFNYDENFLSLDFVALDYTDPEQNRYAYQMVGLDDDWVQAGNRRHADYPNLRPGNYVFRVIGSNNDGVWNDAGASVAITIRPPFWETPWFIGLLIAVLLGMGYGGYRYRVRSLRERSLQLEKVIAERTVELQSTNLQLEQEITEREQVEKVLAEQAAETAVVEERNRLARDLHDAVTQTLFSASLIAEVLPRLWQRNPEEGEQRLNELRELSRGALAEMRTLLLELRPAGIAEARITDLLQQLADSTTGRARLPVQLDIEGDAELPTEVKVTFYRIAQEALNNVTKHADAQQVLLDLKLDEDHAMLSIEDDGQGFEFDDVTTGNLGLAIMRERSLSIGADLVVESEPGAGTRIRLTWINDEDTNSTGGEKV
jgi:signal transduction histidine kinase/ligand-binding sensor domain-containing protein